MLHVFFHIHLINITILTIFFLNLPDDTAIVAIQSKVICFDEIKFCVGHPI